MERLAGEAELFSRAADVPVVAGEGLLDKFLFYLGPCFFERQWPRGRTGRGEFQVCGLEHRALGHDDRPLDPVLQLADVARPGIGPDSVTGFIRHPSHPRFQCFPVPQDEGLGQHHRVLSPFP